MSYEQDMEKFSEEERIAARHFVGLYYEDGGWYPCVPITSATRARAVNHPSSRSGAFRCIQVVLLDIVTE